MEMTKLAAKKLATLPLAFPPAWVWLVDELIPTYVKKAYSPRDSWKDKPFAKEDVRFFSKGVSELSEIYTDERPGKIPAYFLHPKFRSAYLLYFLPLQMAKFVTAFQLHSKAMDAALEHGRKTGVLRIVDLGAGPGTASLAFLLRLLTTSGEIPPIELEWVDTNATIMEDGAEFVEALSSQFPKLRGKVKLTRRVGHWWSDAGKGPETSLILLGHVLNEAQNPRRRTAAPTEDEGELPPSHDQVWSELLSRASGGGILLLEPASRKTSQFLSTLRDQLLEAESIPASTQAIWGPCVHAGACPLAQGRDWCHFSVPVQVPGKWFREFSKTLSTERHWLKFSYLWLATEKYPSPREDKTLRRVISDPLTHAGEVLICEPETATRVQIDEEDIGRGDLIRVR
jgi:ribosomal protein RSM22 (predicted rRNA methylase)